MPEDYLDKAAKAVDGVKGYVIGEKAVETKNEAYQEAAAGNVTKSASLYVRSWGEELSHIGGMISSVSRAAIGTLTMPLSRGNQIPPSPDPQKDAKGGKQTNIR